MATCSSIINRALRKIGRLGAARDARVNDAQDALDVLRGLYTSWVTSGALGRMADIVVSGDVTAGEGQRIVRPIGVASEVTLPETISSFATYPPPPYGSVWPYTVLYEGVDANVRPPADGTAVSVVDQETGTASYWVYDGSLKLWAQIDTLALTDTAPMSSADPEGLAAVLALECADQFGADISPLTARAAGRFMWSLTNKASMPRAIGQGAYY